MIASWIESIFQHATPIAAQVRWKPGRRARFGPTHLSHFGTAPPQGCLCRPDQTREPFRAGEDISGQLKMFTARETTTATVTNDARDCSIINNLAHAVRGIVSVGLNAVALVNEV